MSFASSSQCSTSSCWYLNSIFTLFGTAVFFHDGNAALAACIACFTSTLVECGTDAITAPVAGLGTSSLFSLLDAIHLDRKSTRLNSSHVKISYAVFCLKKK